MENFSEAVELSTLLVNVILIHLISNNEDVVIMADIDHFFDILLGEHLAGRISWINYDDAL